MVGAAAGKQRHLVVRRANSQLYIRPGFLVVSSCGLTAVLPFSCFPADLLENAAHPSWGADFAPYHPRPPLCVNSGQCKLKSFYYFSVQF